MKSATRYLEPWLGKLKMQVLTQRFIRPLLIQTDERCPECKEYLTFVALDSVASIMHQTIDYIGHYSCPAHGLKFIGESEPAAPTVPPITTTA